ncbi:MAG TPA: SIS domain-containing protein [Trueperaceae bacterium]
MTELDALRTDEPAFLGELERLPGSYEGPDGEQPGPYGLTGFGEAASLSGIMRTWIDGPLVTSGTQFLLSAGFEYGELGPLAVTAEMSGAHVVTVGTGFLEPNLEVPPGPLSLYTFVSYLGHATGHHRAVEEIDGALRTIAERSRPELPTELNPAKALAWTLWNRTPLLLASRANSGVPLLVQRAFARVGKSLAVTTGEHPLELVTGAFEGNHALGDDLLALVVGPDDRELELAREVLGTRVAQVERLGLEPVLGENEPADPVARAVSIWYLAVWVAAYLAVLHGFDPGDSGVYDEVRRVAQGESRSD